MRSLSLYPKSNKLLGAIRRKATLTWLRLPALHFGSQARSLSQWAQAPGSVAVDELNLSAARRRQRCCCCRLHLGCCHRASCCCFRRHRTRSRRKRSRALPNGRRTVATRRRARRVGRRTCSKSCVVLEPSPSSSTTTHLSDAAAATSRTEQSAALPAEVGRAQRPTFVGAVCFRAKPSRSSASFDLQRALYDRRAKR